MRRLRRENRSVLHSANGLTTRAHTGFPMPCNLTYCLVYAVWEVFVRCSLRTVGLATVLRQIGHTTLESASGCRAGNIAEHGVECRWASVCAPRRDMQRRTSSPTLRRYVWGVKQPRGRANKGGFVLGGCILWTPCASSRFLNDVFISGEIAFGWSRYLRLKRPEPPWAAVLNWSGDGIRGPHLH